MEQVKISTCSYSLHLILGDNLTPQKARILLMLALTKTKDPVEIQRMMLTY